MPDQTLGVCVIISDPQKKKIILGKRLNTYKAGMYGLPGGRIESGEQILDCGIRELKEETGLQSNSLRYLGVVRELKPDYSFIHFVLICDDHSGKLVVGEPDKCAGWEWFRIESLPENILPGHKAAIDIFLTPQNHALRDIFSED